jgi:hypothetical protein
LHGYKGRNRDTRLYMCCPCIKLFAEVHRLYTASSKSRAHWRGWGSFPGWNEQALIGC